MAIPVQALGVAGQLAEVHGGPGGGDSPLSDVGDGGGVVAEVFERGVVDGFPMGHDVDLSEEGSML